MIKQLNILSVNSDADHQMIIRLSLELDSHIAVVCAGSSAGAAPIVAEGHFDLMLIDVAMPKMSSVETLEMLKTKGE